MTDKKSVIALYLDGPLQSWGYQSRFDRRTTLSHPTRSGVIGLVCAAMGIDRADENALRNLDGLQMEVIYLAAGSLLEDFHTVGGGFDPARDRQSIVRTAEGKPGSTVVTRRYYLQDTRFYVLLRGEESLLQQISAAMQDPKWGIWLGRKTCIPTTPVFQGLFGDSVEALRHVQNLRADSRPFRVVREVESFDEGTDTLNDKPVNFRRREFAPRRIAVEPFESQPD